MNEHQQTCAQETNCDQEKKILDAEKSLLKKWKSPCFKSENSENNNTNKKRNNLSLKIKSTLCSSNVNSTPTLIKLSKSELFNSELTELKTNSLTRKKEAQTKKNIETIEKNLTINSATLNPDEINKHRTCSISQAKNEQLIKDDNHSSFNDTNEKKVNFEDNCSDLSCSFNLETSVKQAMNQDSMSRCSSEKFSDIKRSSKLRRSSLNKLIGNSELLASKKFTINVNKITNNEKENVSCDKPENNQKEDSNEFHENEPPASIEPNENDNAHKPDTSNIVSSKSNENEHKDSKFIQNSFLPSKPTLSLAEIIVKSISSGSNSYNKSRSEPSECSSTSVTSEVKKQVLEGNKN